jgi:hypothetical protein
VLLVELAPRESKQLRSAEPSLDLARHCGHCSLSEHQPSLTLQEVGR